MVIEAATNALGVFYGNRSEVFISQTEEEVRFCFEVRALSKMVCVA